MADILKVTDETYSSSILEDKVCAFGVFDGVHVGHQSLLKKAFDDAHKHQKSSCILTFDKDPDELFAPERLKKLLTNEDRIVRLSHLGFDTVIVFPFTSEFAALKPDVFLERTFGHHAPYSIHVGTNFRFGAHARGSLEQLRTWARRKNIKIYAHELLSAQGKPISATRIRNLLCAGNLATANKLLGYPYQLRATVKRGRGEGGDMGFHTANLHPEANYRLLPDGVYACYVNINNRRYRAAVSVGVSPVFADRSTATCEAHILDFKGDLYEQSIIVEFVEYLRPMIKFDTVEELIATVKANIAWTRENLPL